MFCYFLPNIKRVERAELAEFGLLDRLDANCHQRQAATGPTGSAGLVVSMSSALGYYRDRQKWVPSQCGKYWIGYEQPLTASDLARVEQLDGHSVRLEDGSDWLIPVARSFVNGCVLPQSLALGPDGSVVTEVLPRYVAFSKRAESIWENFIADCKTQSGEPVETVEPSESFTVADYFNIAVEALALNYRVGPQEVSLLRLLTTANVLRIAQAIIDVPTLLELSKKKGQSDEPQCSGGSEVN